MARWSLRRREMSALPKRNCKVRLKHEWQTLTGHHVKPKRPRRGLSEVAALFTALQRADPRLRLLMELAAELRAGQAVRARRSDLLPEPIGGFGLGRFIVHGSGKKHGKTTELHPELRNLATSSSGLQHTQCFRPSVDPALRLGQHAAQQGIAGNRALPDDTRLVFDDIERLPISSSVRSSYRRAC